MRRLLTMRSIVGGGVVSRRAGAPVSCKEATGIPALRSGTSRRTASGTPASCYRPPAHQIIRQHRGELAFELSVGEGLGPQQDRGVDGRADHPGNDETARLDVEILAQFAGKGVVEAMAQDGLPLAEDLGRPFHRGRPRGDLHQHPQQRQCLGMAVEGAAQAARDFAAQVGLGGLRHGLPERPGDAGLEAVRDCRHHRFVIREILVQRADADPGALRDPVGRRLFVAFVHQQQGGRVQDDRHRGL